MLGSIYIYYRCWVQLTIFTIGVGLGKEIREYSSFLLFLLTLVVPQYLCVSFEHCCHTVILTIYICILHDRSPRVYYTAWLSGCGKDVLAGILSGYEIDYVSVIR